MKDKISRLSIISDRLPLQAWQVTLLEHINKDPLFKIIEILPYEKSNSISRLLEWHSWMERKIFRPAASATKRVSTAIEKMVQEKPFNSLTRDTTDLVLWLSSRSPTSDLLQEVQVPIIFMVHGSDHDMDVRSFIFSEFRKRTGFFTSRAVAHLSGQFYIIEETHSMVSPMSLSGTLSDYFWKLSTLIPRALRRIYSRELNDFEKINLENFQRSSCISNQDILQTFGQQLSFIFRKLMDKMLYREQWFILLKNKKFSPDNFQSFNKLSPPKSVFWADPFLIEENERQYLFYEELPFKTGKGHICVREVFQDGALGEAKIILSMDYHLSYPFVFKFSERFFMIPESYEARKIQLFEATQFPYEWQYKMDLMQEVKAFDTTLFFYNNKWWMFTNICQRGYAYNDELHLFYAESPLTDIWISHPKNPIVSDVRSARPAGKIYEENGLLIRPSQNCTGKYGYAFQLNVIEVLNEFEYSERPLQKVYPDWEADLTRTHTFNRSTKATVIDAAIKRNRWLN